MQTTVKAWVKHYSRLCNVEFEYPWDTLPEAPAIAEPTPPVTNVLICKAISCKVKYGKAAKSSGIIAEMLKATS